MHPVWFSCDKLFQDDTRAKELVSKLKPPKKGFAIHFSTDDGINYYTDKEPGKFYSKVDAEKIGEEYEHCITFILCKPLATSEIDIDKNKDDSKTN